MKLAYREYGSGQPLIILHGLFGQSDNWNTLAKQFAEKGFRVFTVDQRNHGLSPHSYIWNYEVMADDLKEFMAEHHLQKPVLLGHSMGGKTVMFFEWKYRNTAGKIIIADISPREYEPHHNEVLLALNAVDFTQVKTRKEVENKLNEYISDFGTKQFLLKNVYWKDSANNIMDWRFDLKTITQNYDNIRVPVPAFVCETKCLVVKGQRSAYITESDKEDFRRRFKNCSFAEVAGAGHWVHAEKPREFFETVIDFLG